MPACDRPPPLLPDLMCACCKKSVAACSCSCSILAPCPPPCPQILLPPSAGASLMGQDAYKNGPMFFQLTNAAGNRTHAGLLEFSAAEGFVALPRKVGVCLLMAMLLSIATLLLLLADGISSA